MDFLVFISGVLAGAGLMAALIFGTDYLYERRHPLVRSGS